MPVCKTEHLYKEHSYPSHASWCTSAKNTHWPLGLMRCIWSHEIPVAQSPSPLAARRLAPAAEGQHGAGRQWIQVKRRSKRILCSKQQHALEHHQKARWHHLENTNYASLREIIRCGNVVIAEKYAKLILK